MQLVAKCGQRPVASFQLQEGVECVLGASPKADCPVPGEPHLSRRHVVIKLAGDRLAVERLPGASNPVLFKGQSIERFQMSSGDFFVIGSTAFHLLSATATTSEKASAPAGPTEAAPAYQFTLGANDLRARGGREDRMRLLDLMELPEVLRTKTRADFYVYACGLLRLATGAHWVRVLKMEGEEPFILAEDANVDRVTAKPMSRTLLATAIKDSPQPVTYCWSHPLGRALAATAHEGVDWAISCAMSVPGEAPILYYLAGATGADVGFAGFDTRSGASTFLRDTARLVGLVADTIGRAISLQKVEVWQTRLRRFFSGKLVSKILEADAAVELGPRIAEASVMFFDIRGFSLLTEGNLQRILEYEGELRRVLTVMTQCIYDHDGVVLRYMGDGILACWNVPYQVAHHVESACLAALQMVEQMNKVTDGWACGIGLGVGDVVAGSLGSEQVYAYDILGAVANQTARVEGITKAVGVPILVTEEVAKRLNEEKILSRRVARFRPAGMEQVVELYTIEATPADPAARQATSERLRAHAQALEAFEAGDWEKTWKMLHPIVESDAAARYVYKLALQGKPPRDWDGIVELTAK